MSEEFRKASASFFLTISTLWVLGANVAIGASGNVSNPCNPCNPCSAKKNPCNPCNPCSAKQNPCNPCNPCSTKQNPCNPCNPCSSKKQPTAKAGKLYFNDKSLSGSGAISCKTCHTGNATPDLRQSKAWPHYVGMAKGVITLDQIIQLCLTQPMAAKAMAWNDPRLTSLALYLEEVRLKKQY
ncbi:MAG: hypothetical protein H8E38_04240 [SAR324 cluster bacterium]|nr:hypothetical protein [SAR324 cluster bacterium]